MARLGTQETDVLTSLLRTVTETLSLCVLEPCPSPPGEPPPGVGRGLGEFITSTREERELLVMLPQPPRPQPLGPARLPNALAPQGKA